MKYTKRGLILNGKGGYCIDWNDLFESEGRNTLDKRKKFKSKYKNLIKQVSYTIDIMDGEKRTHTYMVAHKDLAGNKKESDLQKVVFYGADPCIIQSDSKKLLGIQVSTAYRRIYKDLWESVNYQWDGRYELLDGMIVDVETGEVMIDDDFISSSIKDCINGSKECGSKLSLNDCLWSTLIHIKQRLELSWGKIDKENVVCELLWDEEVEKYFM